MLKLAASYVLMASMIWSAIYYVNGIDKYASLAKSGISGEGRIVKVECENHGTFSYRFEVSGQAFNSHGHARALGLKCDELQQNQKIDVVYLSENPSINVGGSPKEELDEDRTFAGAVSMSFPAFILWMYWRRKRRDI